jgi:zinc transport system substrate-binding protein
MPKFRTILIVASVLIVGAFLGSLISMQDLLGAGERSRVVAATWGVPAEIVFRLGGSEIEVVQLLPPGVELHDWEPTPQALEAVRRSRLLVWTLPELDGWGERLARSAGVPSVMAAQDVKLMEGDVHFWMRPLNLLPLVDHLSETLASVFPELADTVRRNAEALKEELRGLEKELASGLEPLRGRLLVTQHRSFRYLAEAYGLRYYSVLGHEEEEPSAAYLYELRDLIRLEGVRTIFAEDGSVHPVVESLARDLGLSVGMLYTGEGLTLEEAMEGKGYAYLVRLNLGALVAGLGGS